MPVEEDREDEYSGGDALNHINSFQIYKLDSVMSIHNHYGFDVVFPLLPPSGYIDLRRVVRKSVKCIYLIMCNCGDDEQKRQNASLD